MKDSTSEAERERRAQQKIQRQLDEALEASFPGERPGIDRDFARGRGLGHRAARTRATGKTRTPARPLSGTRSFGEGCSAARARSAPGVEPA